MGHQVVSARTLRRAERNTGLTLDRVLRHTNYLWYGRVLTDNGHYHVRIHTDDWTYEEDDIHWTSCGDLAPSDAPGYTPTTTDEEP